MSRQFRAQQPPDPPSRKGVQGTGERRREGTVAEKSRRTDKRPPRYKVVLYNDDFTPMVFVVALLEVLFNMPPVKANALMLEIHRSGKGVAGVYPHDIAETKVMLVHRNAEARGYPLRAAVERD